MLFGKRYSISKVPRRAVKGIERRAKAILPRDGKVVRLSDAGNVETGDVCAPSSGAEITPNKKEKIGNLAPQ